MYVYNVNPYTKKNKNAKQNEQGNDSIPGEVKSLRSTG